MKLVQIRSNCYINVDQIIAVLFKKETLVTSVVVSTGVIDSEYTYEETIQKLTDN